MVNYKLHVPKHTLYYSDTEGTNRTTWLDYWTTVQAEENATDSEIIALGRNNLRKQIAKSELFNIKLYYTIFFENEDIEIVKETKL